MNVVKNAIRSIESSPISFFLPPFSPHVLVRAAPGATRIMKPLLTPINAHERSYSCIRGTIPHDVDVTAQRKRSHITPIVVA